MTKLERLREAIILALDPYFPNPQEQMPLVVDDVLAAILVELRVPDHTMRQAALRFCRDPYVECAYVAIIDAILSEQLASKSLPEGQGPEMTQEQISAFRATWKPFVDVLKGDSP